MATYNQGVLGDFSGKIGPIIGSNWRGKAVMRSLPSKNKKAPSKAQQEQRDKFAFVMQFLNPLNDLLMQTFGDNTGTKTPFINALSYHLKDAVLQTATGFSMRYPKVLISKGPLCGIEQPVLSNLAAHTLLLQWVDNSNQGLAYAKDSLIVIAYAPSLDKFEYFIETAFREDTQASLQFSNAFQGQDVQLWACFTNSTLEHSSTSRYLGAFYVS